jgi:hypothetical protein
MALNNMFTPTLAATSTPAPVTIAATMLTSTPTPFLTHTSTPTQTPTPTTTPDPPPTYVPQPTSTYTPTPIPTPTPTSTPTSTPTATSTSTPTATSTPTPTPTLYPALVLDRPVDGVLSEGRLPVLYWYYTGELPPDEYFEVRIWHKGELYHTGIVWVKEPIFNFNLQGFPTGQYFWSIIRVRSDNVKSKGWEGMGAWEGIPPVIYLSKESEIRSFNLSIERKCGPRGC